MVAGSHPGTEGPHVSPVGPVGSGEAWALIPARLGSTRLPHKMLLAQTGRPLFQHTVENVRQSGVFARVVLATDAEAILSAAERVGIEAVMTDPGHQSGTDRCLEAYRRLVSPGKPAPAVLVNVQGDEPELDPADLARLVRRLDEPQVALATLWAPLAEPGDLERPEIVKVTATLDGRALYFSRAAIPSRGHAAGPQVAPAGLTGAQAVETTLYKRHIGVYAFRPASLAHFCSLGPSSLEQCERLEQLRWLENGGSIHLVRAQRLTRGIDTPEDYAEFVRRQAAGA
jgi:3-deoxy-manno-octulosonate cytidylyltransferase (CMP-KDO synthetase)